MYIGFGLLIAFGGALFLIGMTVVADKPVYDDQVPGLNLAIVGVVVANSAGVLLLMAGRRAVALRRVRIFGGGLGPADDTASGTPLGNAAGLIGGEGLVHFHRTDCAMTAGRDWPVSDRATHERAGRIACGVCKP